MIRAGDVPGVSHDPRHRREPERCARPRRRAVTVKPSGGAAALTPSTWTCGLLNTVTVASPPNGTSGAITRPPSLAATVASTRRGHAEQRRGPPQRELAVRRRDRLHRVEERHRGAQIALGHPRAARQLVRRACAGSRRGASAGRCRARLREASSRADVAGLAEQRAPELAGIRERYRRDPDHDAVGLVPQQLDRGERVDLDLQHRARARERSRRRCAAIPGSTSCATTSSSSTAPAVAKAMIRRIPTSGRPRRAAAVGRPRRRQPQLSRARAAATDAREPARGRDSGSLRRRIVRPSASANRNVETTSGSARQLEHAGVALGPQRVGQVRARPAPELRQLGRDLVVALCRASSSRRTSPAAVGPSPRKSSRLWTSAASTSSALPASRDRLLEALDPHVALAAHDLDQQPLLGAEVVVQQPARDAGLARDVVERRACDRREPRR